MDITTVVEKVEKLLSDNHIGRAEVEPFDDSDGRDSHVIGAFTVHIEWGDWRHEHLKAKYLIESNNIGLWTGSETTDEDGTDCYSATHYFVAH